MMLSLPDGICSASKPIRTTSYLASPFVFALWRPSRRHSPKTKSLLGLLYLSIGLSSCQPNPPVVLELRTLHVREGKLYLYNTEALTTDTLSWQDFRLQYARQLDGPTLFYGVMEGYNTWDRPLKLVLSPEITRLQFDHLEAGRETAHLKDAYPNTPVFLSDPNGNAAYYTFRQQWLDFMAAVQALAPPDTEKDTLLAHRKSVYDTFIEQSSQLIIRQPQCLVSGVILAHLVADNLLPLSQIQTLYRQLDPAVQSSSITRAIREEASFEAGRQAPDFHVVDKDERTYRLADLKGKKVLLHFWSSGCAPCLKEAPELLQLQANHSANQLVILNVSLDTDRQKWLAGMNRAKFQSMIHVCDLLGKQSPLIRDYHIRAISAYCLIDEQGNLITKGDLPDVKQALMKEE